MPTILATLLAVYNLVKNKLAAIVVLILLACLYRSIPADKPVPFAELLYAVILISSVTILAPIMRLLVFPEVATYAEGGGLAEDLKGQTFHPAIIHYWIATIICYLTAILCVSGLLSH